MRIDLNSIACQPGDSSELTKSRTTEADLNQATVSDTASLSSRSAALQRLNATASELPQVRQERVAALSQMVRNGTYQVRSEQTADALMSQIRQVPAA